MIRDFIDYLPASLASLSNLTTLYIRDNLLSNVSPLVKNSGLGEGNVGRGSPLTKSFRRKDDAFPQVALDILPIQDYSYVFL